MSDKLWQRILVAEFILMAISVGMLIAALP